MLIIVIGASRGGLEAIKHILMAIPENFPASVLVAMHVGAFDSQLPSILGPYCKLEVRHAVDGETLGPNRVLIAPPDKHLLVDGQTLRLIKGAKENFSRPAIDPLFRSTAISHRENVIGVILTGDLDDGTVGLQAVKTCGGVALVQDPLEATAPSMPSSALRHVDIDGCLPLSLLADKLIALTQRKSIDPRRSRASLPTPVMVLENTLSLEGALASVSDLDAVASRSTLTCPECNGVLWEMDNAPFRYRCHTGHTFSELTYRSTQDKSIEESLWGAVRALHEKQTLMERMKNNAHEHGRAEAAAEYGLLAEQASEQSKTLINLLKMHAAVPDAASS